MCLFNRYGSSVSSSVSDIRASLKDFMHFMRVKKISEPIKLELDEYLADALDEASLDADFDILTW
jgi:hypothetical protein